MLFKNQLIPGSPKTEYPKSKQKSKSILKREPCDKTPLHERKPKIKSTVTFDLERFANMQICDADMEMKLSLYASHREYQDEIISEITDLLKRYHMNEENLSLIFKNLNKK